VRDNELPADESDEAAAPAGAHPAGEIRLSPTRAIGLRVSALGGLAVGAMIAATPTLTTIHPTSGP
jgi:hypothetical protein